ncbi:MAG: type IV secretory system conjugative DNA transfer family protein [Gemmatimonadetes bacterium]|nr:type IV secretory system conjugative DNA transfer family protein [Gemmatimonadota bacterium]MDQ3308557.1 type IV secretory system conjugative DNA transfer family protein [Gemmatimonadota bacterium]
MSSDAVAGTALFAGAALTASVLPSLRRLAVPLFAVATVVWAASLGPLHPPHRFLVWSEVYASIPAITPILSGGMLTLFAALLLSVLGSLVLVSGRGVRMASGSHGTAAWDTGDELVQATGLLVGRHDTGRMLRFSREGHVITLAPTRSGKGISAVIPNLLEYPGSVVVSDPKGENYVVTSRRRREMGQQVVALDPFCVAGGTAAFNPLDLIDVQTDSAVDDATMLADMLVMRSGKGSASSFWDEEATTLLRGLILYVAAVAGSEQRSLAHVRELLTLAPEPFQDLLDEMAASPAVGGLVKRAAAMMLQKADKERSGVISTAQSHTRFLDSPRMAHVLDRSTFDLADLKRRRVSLYLILPPNRMNTYQRWLRLMIACTLSSMVRIPGRPAERVLVLLDEFANLGRMQPVLNDIALAGGYGVAFWLVLQDLPKLKGIYPDDWGTFLSNRAVLQAFGTADLETSEYLSKMVGETTIFTESENRSRGRSSGKLQQSTAQTTSEKGRRLLTPDEVQRLHPEMELVFVKGSNPLLVRRLNYLEDPEFRDAYDENPTHAAV